MRVCCVIVTYANRFTLLLQVVEEVLRQGASQVVIIDNGSVEASAIPIDHLAARFPSIILYRFSENKGSAGGFRKGLEIALGTECDFIWTLDDDNLPLPGVLPTLVNLWTELDASRGGDSNLALLAMRNDREEFNRVLREKKSSAIFPPINSFLGFHIREVFQKLSERIGVKRMVNMPVSEKYFIVDAATYGGLFLPKKILYKIDLPNDSFILYNDDFDFTYRITKLGGEILLVSDCVIQDIDRSFYMPDRKRILYHSSLDTKNASLVYYMIRNSVYFSKRNLVTNKAIYFFNKYLFLGIIGIMAVLKGKLKRLPIIYTAIEDGENGKLGKRIEYML